MEHHVQRGDEKGIRFEVEYDASGQILCQLVEGMNNVLLVVTSD